MENKPRLRKILLIDDDSDDRMYFIEGVKQIVEGIECVTAQDGEQALALLNRPDFTLPNFIFLDLRMPRINGRQCLQQMKADERLKDIPVIIYSTSREVEEINELKNLGAVQVITKPSDPEEIYYVLSLVLEER